MATHRQWRRLHIEEHETKRLTYAYGPDRILCEDVVDTIRRTINPHDMDYASISAVDTKLKDILANLNQYPLEPTNRRLVVVRDVERIKSWDGVLDWLMSRLMPQVICIMVDSRHDIDTTQPHMERIIKSGRLVKCGPLNAEDAIAYIHSLGSISDSAAKMLYSRTGGHLGRMTDVMRKAALFEGQVTEKVVEVLTEPTPASSFVDSLLRMRKVEAVEAAECVSEEDLSMIIGALDYRLDMLQRINRAMQRQQPIRELISATRVPAFLVKDMLPYAKHYDRTRVRSCTGALALVDSQFQAGARTGLLETLTVLW